jgi:pyrimidine-nucleoside phosphorylase
MISGRALGHTGGTLDKLESIPGFNIKMSAEEICRNTIEIGAVMVGQSEKLVPADMKIYALRDVTCTVKSFPLITASILSKKAAEGIDALVMDVKVGEGAIFPEPQEMETLAHWLVQVGNEFGIETVALLTDMDQPLGYAVGNWLEVKECIDILKSGTGAPDLLELNRVFCGKMLKLGGIAKSDEEGMLLADSALKDGKAFAKFRQIAQNQGGDVSFLDNPEKCPPAKFRQEIIAPASGYISQIHARKVGELSMLLDAGRARKEDAIDYTAGVIFHKKVGDYIEKGEILAVLFSNSEDKLEKVAGIFEEVFEFSDTLPDKRKLIIKNIVS